MGEVLACARERVEAERLPVEALVLDGEWRIDDVDSRVLRQHCWAASAWCADARVAPHQRVVSTG